MIDNVKIAIPSNIARELRHNSLLRFQLTVDDNTGEVYKEKASYENLTFTIHRKGEGYCEMKGSLHSFYSGANYSDYTIIDYAATLNQLHTDFGINPQIAVLKNLEVGVNLSDLPATPDQIIKAMLYHRGTTFSKMPKYEIGGNRAFDGVIADHQRFNIKIYNKGQQFNLPYPVLRYELKYKKMEDMKKLGVYHPSDLLEEAVLEQVGRRLCNTFNDIIMIEPQLTESELNDEERLELLCYKNSRYWEELSTKKRYYWRDKYKRLVEKHVAIPTQPLLARLIQQKWHELTKVSSKKLEKPTLQQGQYNPLYYQLIYPATEIV